MKLRTARKWAATSMVALSLATLSATAAQAATDTQQSAMASAPAPAPVSELIDAVSIPYEQFKLDNGLTVLVHTDRSAPVVAVSVWYGVGSKHEPKGKTGFAHLFEHLMFNGSEHSPGDFFEPLQQVGATDFNGTTWFDRTNYFETVPSAALDTALFLESDRMGYLLGAVTQEKLDNQIGVVQNEKRQGDNQPYGLVEYEQLENLYPVGHPYHHSTIGSMKDLSGATLDDVKNWFTDHYGPNNAILVLAGDIDLATAKQKVTKWFGAIPAGPKVAAVSAPVPTLPAPLTKTIYDKVATPRVYRMWAVPGLDNPDYIPLAMGATVLGGLASSRLDNALVRQQKIAVSVSASADIFAQAGQFVIFADAKPGVSEEELGKALDAEIAKFVAEGPTADELQRASTVYAAGQIRGLDSLGGFNGKAPTLAQGLLYNGDPKHYKAELETAAATTPAKVKAVTAKYLSRPAFQLTVTPGERKEGGEDRGGWGAATLAAMTGAVAGEKGAPARHPAYYMAPGSEAGVTFATAADRAKVPEIGTIKPLKFPKIERAKLANGMEVYFARRDSVPTVSVKIDFDAGYAADPRDKLGLQSLMLRTMNEGTTDLDSQELAIAKERLGASLSGYASLDETSFGLDALVPNFAASLDLMSDYIRHPAFDNDALERARTQQLTRIKNEMNNPGAIAQRALFPTLFGSHPYGIAPSGTGDADVVAKLTKADLEQFHNTWLRPDRAKVFVVGDTTLAEVTKLLEASFGDWKNPTGPAPKKDFSATIPAQQSRVILIDRPSSPQSVIYAGRVLPHKGSDDLIVLESANEVFGGSFLSRINMNLRETKGWSYGVRSSIVEPDDRTTFTIYAPVQADKTGESIVELRKDLDAYTTGGKGVTQEELVRLVNGNVRELPGRFATAGGVLNGMVNIIENKRPDNYYETLGAKYTALTADQLDKAALADLKGNDLVFVVVGDAKVVEPQLKQVGLPVEVRKADSE
ncbi:M16 family metallopeptidase [Tsuneonella suprasediminis]|nr:pitrilysin family protein [Tsuneonella suprasediminis]